MVKGQRVLLCCPLAIYRSRKLPCTVRALVHLAQDCRQMVCKFQRRVASCPPWNWWWLNLGSSIWRARSCNLCWTLFSITSGLLSFTFHQSLFLDAFIALLIFTVTCYISFMLAGRWFCIYTTCSQQWKKLTVKQSYCDMLGFLQGSNQRKK